LRYRFKKKQETDELRKKQQEEKDALIKKRERQAAEEAENLKAKLSNLEGNWRSGEGKIFHFQQNGTEAVGRYNRQTITGSFGNGRFFGFMSGWDWDREETVEEKCPKKADKKPDLAIKLDMSSDGNQLSGTIDTISINFNSCWVSHSIDMYTLKRMNY
jgi:restriction endonuclease S subunit